MKRYYCTYFDRNYLIKALALIESLNKYETNDFELFAVCMDEITRVILNRLNFPNVVLVPMHEIEQRDFPLLATKRDRSFYEYYWTATPTIILRILGRNPEIDILTYLDSDLFFFSSPDPIFEELGTRSVLIHEHRFSPSLSHIEPLSGKYNVGLLCFRNDTNGLKVLNWWRKRCIEWCYHRTEGDKMGDQMYLNDWPTRFEGVVVLQNIGGGVAPWNHEQYTFSIDESNRILVNKVPLIFYHFQSLTFIEPDIIVPAKHLPYPLTKEVLLFCFIPYVNTLSRAIKSLQFVFPDFNFGLFEKDVLTSEHTFLAKSERSTELIAMNVSQRVIHIDGEWDCYSSTQCKDFLGLSELIDNINKLYRSGKVDEAYSTTLTALNDYSDCPDLLNFKALLDFRKGNIKEAGATLLRIIEQWPKYSLPLFNNVAVGFWENGDTLNALKYFSLAYEINPINRDTVMHYGKALMSLKKFEEAGKIFVAYLDKIKGDEEISQLLREAEDAIILPIILSKSHDKFSEWIIKHSRFQNRLYYNDQTVESLTRLVELVHHYKPTKIIELGTLFGLSLRTWLVASPSVNVTAIDLSFEHLFRSQSSIPLNSSRVTFFEQNILTIDFSHLWEPSDRVLFYVDAHDEPDVLIMNHLLQNAFPILPQGSVVAVDDIWYNTKTLSHAKALDLFDKVRYEADPLLCLDFSYAPYWKGGSFLGFREVVPLMEWVNRNRVNLIFVPGTKVVAFEWPQTLDNNTDEEFDSESFKKLSGKISYNPIDWILTHKSEEISENSPALNVFKKGSQLFAANRLNDALNCFLEALKHDTQFSSLAYHAVAICLAREGQFKDAANALNNLIELSPFSDAYRFSKDIQKFLKRQETWNQRLSLQNNFGKITFFTIPKPFRGHINIIQRNAIKSWTLLHPQIEIILLGDEEGTAEVAEKLGVKHIPNVEKNEFGTPLINSAFDIAQSNSSNGIMVYINSDIIFMKDFLSAIQLLKESNQNLDMFLMVGQRWDTDLTESIDFSVANLESQLKRYLVRNAVIHEPTGIDYFVFSEKLFKKVSKKMPSFAIGRPGWDNWVINFVTYIGAIVIDASEVITAIHQNHSYTHIKEGFQGAFFGEEAKRNLRYAESYGSLKTIDDASHRLTLFGIQPKLTKCSEATSRDISIKSAIQKANQGVRHLEKGKLTQALDYLDYALTSPFGRFISELQWLRGLCLFRMGRFEEAKRALEAELKMQPGHHDARKLLHLVEQTLYEKGKL